MLSLTTIHGRLTADPIFKKTPSGKNCAVFNIATDRDYKDKNGKKVTDFNHVVTWGGVANAAKNLCKKGTGVIIVGRYQSYDKETSEGKIRLTSLNAHQIYVIQNFKETSFEDMGKVEEAEAATEEEYKIN